MKTIKHFLLVVMMLLSSSMAKAWDLVLEGKVGNYPVIMQMNVSNNGNRFINGRYAFVSTLRKNGVNKKSSWLYFESNDRYLHSYSVYDSNNKVVETWENVSWDEYRNTVSFYGKVITASKKIYRLNVSCDIMRLTENALSILFDY